MIFVDHSFQKKKEMRSFGEDFLSVNCAMYVVAVELIIRSLSHASHSSPFSIQAYEQRLSLHQVPRGISVSFRI